jgi:transcriptional regulator with GAF, ATPase, and Fis domain
MRQTLAQMQRVAKTDATVLILGETGVGKEVLARAIHRSSDRKDRPFVRLNCAALPPHLIESELFGHERGAFTGAASRRLGRFEVANDATLFLDEIGELPLELQAKLLRVLQESEFERLGSSKTISVDVRLVAATSRNLQECVQKGSFRADLFYRLNVFPIAVPALRSRKEDIVPLAAAFLAKVGQRLGKEFAPISAAVAESLLIHRWPGNVRELENVIERAAISSESDVLQLPDGWDGGVEPMSSGRSATPRSAGSGQVKSYDPTPGLGSSDLVSIRELERAHILLALERSKWRIEGPEGAAVALGIKPSTLRFRMKKYSISRDIGTTAHE